MNDENSTDSDIVTTVHLDGFTRWIVSPSAAAAFGGLAAYALRSPRTVSAVIAAAAYIAIAITIFATMSFRLKMDISAEEIFIRNFVRSYRIRRQEIESIDCSYDGMVFHLRSGKRYLARAVPRWNIDLVLRRKGRAEKLAERIMPNGPAPLGSC
jgi:hypothetical protein